MSVQVFKDGESLFIDPDHLNYHLEGGWSLEAQEPETATGTPGTDAADAEVQAAAYNPETVTDTIIDPPPKPEPNEDEMNNEQIRQRAQQSGIENWKSAQIRTLKAQLGLN